MARTKRTRFVIALISAFLLSALGVATGIAGATKSAGLQGAKESAAESIIRPPTKPPFTLDADGKIMPESLPEKIGYRGPDGKLAGYLSREEFLDLLTPPDVPPKEISSLPDQHIGPRPDRTTVEQESASGRVITTITDHRTGEVTRTQHQRPDH